MYCPTDCQALNTALEVVYSSTNRQIGIHKEAAPRLATLLLALALGRLFSEKSRPEAYHLFSAASALITIPTHHFLVRHSLAAVEALHMMVTFLFTSGQTESARAAWLILRMAIRLACAMGLHRNSAEWGLQGRERSVRERLRRLLCRTWPSMHPCGHASPQTICDLT